MKKFIVIVLSLLLVLALAACGAKQPEADPQSGVSDVSGDEELTAQIPNPVVDVDSAEAFRELGITLEAPANAADVTYSVINKELAQINFTVDGVRYNLRAAKTADDISGLYGDVKDEKTLDDGAVLTEIGNAVETYYKITWTADDVSYVLSNTQGATADTITAVYDSLK